MKAIILFALLSVCVADYTTKYDKVNVEDILRSIRLLKRYVDCLLGVPKTCNKDGLMLKDILPNALLTKCNECNEHQKKMARRVANYLIDCKPEWWAQLEKMYDPKGVYRTQYRDDLIVHSIDAQKHSTKCYN